MKRGGVQLPPVKPPNVKSLIGRRFGKLKVKAYAGSTKWGHTQWCCECDCSAFVTVPGRRLLAQDKHRQISCGCARRDPAVRWKARMKVPAKRRAAICKKMRESVKERKPAYSLNARAAAELLGVSEERIEILAQDGMLGSRRRRGELYVSSGDVSGMLAEQCAEQKRCASREMRDIERIARASARRVKKQSAP